MAAAPRPSGESRPHPVPHAQQIHVDDPPEFLGLVLVQPRHAPRAGVVEGGVEAAQTAGGLVDRSSDRVGVPDVDPEGDAVDLGGDGLRGVTVDVEDGHPSALLGEAPAGAPPDARATSRHHRPAAVQERHEAGA